METVSADSWFRVEVSDGAGQIVAIEPDMLAGRDIGPHEATKIRQSIRHLQGFIGDQYAPTPSAAESGETKRKFEFLLNAMEGAGNQVDPHAHNYGDKRRAVLEYIAAIEHELSLALAAGRKDAQDAARYRLFREVGFDDAFAAYDAEGLDEMLDAKLAAPDSGQAGDNEI